MAEANPFQDPLRFERRVPPCAVVIFGANGDLTKRKLIPALYRLAYERRLIKAMWSFRKRQAQGRGEAYFLRSNK